MRIDLFCEDVAHEGFARALCERVASEENAGLAIKVASARAGLPRLQRELRAFSVAVQHQGGTPDILVVVADANSEGPAARRADIEAVDLSAVFPRWVIGTPDPCVEAWLLADPPSLAQQFGGSPQPPGQAGADELKVQLAEYLRSTGEVVTQGGAEFADEIVAPMDLYRAGQVAPTLGSFVDDLRAAMRQTALGD